MQTQTHQQPLVLSENKQKIRRDFEQLKSLCEKSNNWSEIRPIFDRLQGDLDNYFVASEST